MAKQISLALYMPSNAAPGQLRHWQKELCGGPVGVTWEAILFSSLPQSLCLEASSLAAVMAAKQLVFGSSATTVDCLVYQFKSQLSSVCVNEHDDLWTQLVEEPAVLLLGKERPLVMLQVGRWEGEGLNSLQHSLMEGMQLPQASSQVWLNSIY